MEIINSGINQKWTIPQLVTKFIQMSQNSDLVACPDWERWNITNEQAVGLCEKSFLKQYIALSKVLCSLFHVTLPLEYLVSLILIHFLLILLSERLIPRSNWDQHVLERRHILSKHGVLTRVKCEVCFQRLHILTTYKMKHNFFFFFKNHKVDFK